SGEEATVLSGGQRVTPAWRPWRDGIQVADLPAGSVVDELFIDGRRQPLARYPNADPVARHWGGSAADCLDPARTARWRDPTGGIVHALHQHEWGGLHYRIAGRDAAGGLVLEGGWQNNRPSGMHERYRFVEGILEELDAPGEWHFDAATARLCCFPPVGVDLATATVEAVRLRHLIEVRGDATAPVRWLTLRGFTLRHTARTFMDTREPLLRSDWTIYRGGALLVAGAEDLVVEALTIDQVGGNAVFIDGWNRRVAVRSCHIVGAGASGVALVGRAACVRDPHFAYEQRRELDALDREAGPRADDHPVDCVVEDCLIHATGRIEKQSAPVQISMARRITVRDCSLYDVPRAGINIGDGCWGGHLIEGCDVFDTVLETGDHGSFNSWGRERYWVPDIAEGTARVRASPGIELADPVEATVIRRSRWRCDHGWDIDLDDGSTHYRIEENLLLAGGLKLREGWHRTVQGNVMVGNGFHPHVWHEGSRDVFRANIVGLPHQPIGMPAAWGDVVDANLLHRSGCALGPATELQALSGADARSLVGDAGFRDAARGDYRVAPGSPALALGFVDFPMDRFGVRSPRLRALARTPRLPAADDAGTSASSRDATIHTWLGARIKNVVGLGEVSAAGLPGETGVLILAVVPGSVAERCGLRGMDVIRARDGVEVEAVDALLRGMPGASTARSATLGIWRNQALMAVTIAV
ncbi:MAG: PDZ domain-containing protein, partial [Planctomycetes bacterium]|nr:PDZ domain-containing protein [Planctomycetota bacterium]